MSSVKGKEWITNYINMVIDEVKDSPIETRQSVEFRIKISKKHQTFYEKFPSLLLLVVEQATEFDKSRLNTMLDLMDSVQKGEKDADDVDKQLGKEYYDKYVSPVVKPDQ